MNKLNIKIRQAKFKEVIGTGGTGSVFASLDQLKVALGEPHDCTVAGEWESRDNKVRAEWAFIINNDKRLVFTIYDYKSRYPLDKIKQWSFGGRSDEIKEYLKEMLLVEKNIVNTLKSPTESEAFLFGKI